MDRLLEEAAAPPPLDGTRYHLVRWIGSGGMGSVWETEDRELDRPVAMKVLDTPDASGDLAHRLRREARVLARLDHPNIVPIYDVGTLADGRPYYTMKLVRGRQLDEHLGDRPWRTEDLRTYERVCEAVAFAHGHGVVHRDLKPENVLVGAFGEALVVDWGIARVVGERDTRSTHRAGGPADTAPGALVGTPWYMAPEQARGEQAGPAADVYALGGLLHFLLVRRAPHAGDSVGETLLLARETPHLSPRALDRSVPPALDAICRRATTRDPGSRYGSAVELAADVAHFLDREPVAAYAEPFVERLGRLAVRHRVLLALVGAYVLMRVALIWMRANGG